MDTTWKWIADAADKRLNWKFVSNANYTWLLRIQRPHLGRYITAWRAAWKGRKSQIIVTHGEKTAIWTGVFLRLLRAKPLFIAWAFTVPNRESYSRLRNAIMRFGLKHVDRFLMFSEIERASYPDMLGLPPERFEMIHWSVAKPEFDTSIPALQTGEYIAAIGGEGRDYATFFKAMEQLPDLQAVVVGSATSLEGLVAPDNVKVYVEIPYQEAMNIAQHAMFLVLPLISKEIPCGHGSLITQFYLKKATVITDSDAMQGYVFPDQNALTYPAGDPDVLKEQIQRLLSDESFRNKIAGAGEAFANKYCTEQFTVDYFNSYVNEQFFKNEKAGNRAIDK